jgi:hypothetical protein
LGFLKVLSRGHLDVQFILFGGFDCLLFHLKNINILLFLFFQSPNKIIEKVQKESGRGFLKMDIFKMSKNEKGPIIFFRKIMNFDFAAFCSKLRFFGKMLFA